MVIIIMIFVNVNWQKLLWLLLPFRFRGSHYVWSIIIPMTIINDNNGCNTDKKNNIIIIPADNIFKGFGCFQLKCNIWKIGGNAASIDRWSGKRSNAFYIFFPVAFSGYCIPSLATFHSGNGEECICRDFAHAHSRAMEIGCTVREFFTLQRKARSKVVNKPKAPLH